MWPKMAKLELSEGVSVRLPNHVEEVGDLHESQTEFPDEIEEYKSASCCFFLVLF